MDGVAVIDFGFDGAFGVNLTAIGENGLARFKAQGAKTGAAKQQQCG
jgi:hypothetical protein